MTSSADFTAEVAERANLSDDDALELIKDFLSALPGFVTRDTWELIAELTPVQVSVEWEDVSEGVDMSMEDFLLEMSDEEHVELERAAEHARAVAETIRSRSSAEQLDRLRESITNEDLLALFETERGELTSADAQERPE